MAADLASRVELLALLKEIGILISLQVAHGDQVTTQFEKFFRLAPDEVARLNALISATRARGNALVAARATGGISPDGKKLIVDVPVFPEEGGAVYDEMLVGISQVLGPERFAHFDAVAGRQFESTFHQFGLQQVRYEVSLEPSATYAGTPQYSYRLYHADGEAFSPVSGGSAPAVHLLRQLPFLERFLPPDFGQPPAQ